MRREHFLSQMTIFGRDPRSYGSRFNFGRREAERAPQDVFDNPGKYVLSDSPYAPSAEYESAGYQAKASIGSGRGAKPATAYLFRKKTPVDPITKIEYRNDPAQAAQIAELQKQLKILQDVPKYEPYDFSEEKAAYEKQISDLNLRIGGMQTGYQTSLADLTKQMQAEREAAEKQLGLSFQSQLAEQQKAYDERFAGQQTDFSSRLEAQRQSAEEQLARQQTLSAKQLDELKGMYQSQLGTASLERQTLEQQLKQQQEQSAASQLKFQQSLASQQQESAAAKEQFEKALAAQQQTSAANQLKFQEALSAQQQTAAADRLKFSESLASQQAAAQKEFEALRGIMSQQRQQYEAGLAAERAANEQARQEQAMAFQRSLSSQRAAPQVEGIRYASRGPAAQPKMRGISGTFGRRGGRLMKISALNI